MRAAITAFASLTILLCSCYHTETVTGLTEPALVVDRKYKEPETDFKMVREYDLWSEEWVLVPKTTIIPEKFETTFRCQHGVFTVDDKELYYRLKVEDRVIVTYNEILKVQESGGKETKTHMDFDFISARKVNPAELDELDFEEF